MISLDRRPGLDEKGMPGGWVADAEDHVAGERGFQGVSADLGAPTAQEIWGGVRITPT